MILAGIDYSMTAPGLAILDTRDELKFENIVFHGFSSTKKYPGTYDNIKIHPMPGKDHWASDENRYRWLANLMVTIMNGYGVQIAAVEGLSMGSKKGSILNVAQNQGELRQAMLRQAIQFKLVAPTEVKKNFTGKGNAKKKDMIDAFHERFDEMDQTMSQILGCAKHGKPTEDLVDAYAILDTLMSRYMKLKETN